MLKQIVHSNISAYLELNELLNDNQSSFRKGYSTVSTVAHFTDDIFLAMNENQSTLAVYINLRKAFDTVNHTILIKQIEKLGLNVSTVKWLTSYLTNRRQCTVANGTTSEKAGITCVSILGPLLFLIYVNDLSYRIKNCNIKLYADDTVIQRPNPDLSSQKTTGGP